MAVRIECIDLRKQFGPTLALRQVNWTVEAGSVSGLLGESGAGKTTLLRMIARLDTPTDGKVVVTVPGSREPSRRPAIGMVFQNLALWPHLTARRHVQLVLSSLPRKDRRKRAEEVLAQTRLPPSTWDRRPGKLSGGEAYRLALARALASRPELLLLDEPLAQMDTVLREELLKLIDRIIKDHQVTVIYVTHRWDEAARLCRTIAVMRQGKIEMVGSPEEVFFKPCNPEVARLTGPVVEFPGQLLEEGWVACSQTLPPAESPTVPPTRSLTVRPHQVRLVEPCGRNRWKSAGCHAAGTGWLLALSNEQWQISIPSATPLEPGQAVGVELQPVSAGSLHGLAGSDKSECW